MERMMENIQHLNKNNNRIPRGEISIAERLGIKKYTELFYFYIKHNMLWNVKYVV